ncbi:hypothetical protein EDF46_1398 [Frondihabitans sp. PhB188]|uniref:hypothetical protein n=1 Tax=Frondihabitans sp. PhB188 TaxID=2485200 RepID=UPI000F461DAF|nr:hypothetical protein [Frondihabitans sp. PhB188]ROQ39766.1 hypothetical protein EDF46_1398 [Frondihabitans sp. PhB188]
MSLPRSRTALLAFTGLSALGVLTGCSAGAASTGGGSSADAGATKAPASSDSGSTSGSSAPADAGSGTYEDGAYTEQGTYSSPGGQEVISVTLTIASDTVKAVDVKTVKADPTATQYEAKFIGGISDAIVGTKIDDLNVTNVAGSSLTSQGFDDALSKIKSDATA